MKAFSWSSLVSSASSEALNVKEANAVPIDLGSDGMIGVCVEVVAAAEAAAAGEAAASAAFAVETSIGSCEADAAGEDDGDGKGEMVIFTVVDFPLGVTGVLMVGGLLKAGPLLAGVRPICQ